MFYVISLAFIIEFKAMKNARLVKKRSIKDAWIAIEENARSTFKQTKH